MPGTARPYPRGVDADREWATRRNRAVTAHAADLARREATEAVLKLRALVSNGDFPAYWAFHLTQEHQRVHQARYQATPALAA